MEVALETMCPIQVALTRLGSTWNVQSPQDCRYPVSISKGGIRLIRTYCDYSCLFGAYFLMVNAR